MRRALELAARGWGRVSPNPMVGAVVLRDDAVVGEGWHEGPGTAHAEVMALAEAGDRARGATVVCTLEPCDHTGRTGPCTRALIEAGVARVVVGAGDPNPVVDGAGVARLRAAGIDVVSDVLADECHRLNEAYDRHVTTGRPFVTLKMAVEPRREDRRDRRHARSGSRARLPAPTCNACAPAPTRSSWAPGPPATTIHP